MSQPALWQCPHCGRSFANRNQTHTCAELQDLERHFLGKSAAIREIFDAFVARFERIGPVRVMPQKTRIAFQVRMTFAQLQPKQGWIDGHLVLAERHDDPLFRRVVTYSPRNHTHEFRLFSASDLTSDSDAYLRLAYAVGEQRHLKRSRAI